MQKQSVSRNFSIKKSQGQIVVEYVLLLAVAVSIALLIVTRLVKRGDPEDAENSGAIIRKWRAIQQEVGQDLPEDTTVRR